MIVKFIVKNIADPKLSALLNTSLYHFSNNNNKGFNNFQRKKKQQTNNPTQTTQEPKKQMKKQEVPNNQENNSFKINKQPNQKQQNINRTENNSGFANFQRKRKQQSAIHEDKPPHQNKQASKQELSQNKVKNTFQNIKKQTENLQSQNKIQNDSEIGQNNSKTHGFSNFNRRKFMNGFHKNTYSKRQNNQDIKNKAQTNTQQNTQQFINRQKQINTNQAKGFQNFRRRKQTSKSSLNNNFESDLKKQVKKDEPQGFHNFKARTPKKQNEVKKQQNKQQQKQNQAYNSKTQQKTAEEKKYEQQLQKQKQFFDKIFSMKNKSNLNQKKADQNENLTQQQRQLKQKQQFFQRKILQYKLQQAQKNQQGPFAQSKSWFSQKYNQLIKLVYNKTGIDLNANIPPPKFVQSRQQLLLLYRLLTNKRLLLALFIALLYFSYESHIQQISPQQFNQYIANGDTFKIQFIQNQFDTSSEIGKKSNNYVIIYLKNGEYYKCVSNAEFQSIVKNKILLMNMLQNQHGSVIMVDNRKKIDRQIVGQLRNILGMVMMYLFFSSIMGAKGARKGPGAGGKSAFGMQDQSKSKRFMQQVNVKFNDVVGMQKAKQQIVEFIDFLKRPQKYHKLGAKIPRGALLTGPPGTGKTMIAKACAGQSKVPFFTISGSEFMEMYVGVGAQRVRDLFEQARKAAPSIIFIDQIDAVGKKRTTGFGGGNDERDNTLNQLLVQMDGFNTNSNVIVFAATNQKDVLDPALTRPGRFDRMIQVDLPDIQGRRQIFMVHLKPIVIDNQSSMQVYAKRMATLTPGFSGADIKNLCNQAAIMAARNGHLFVTMQDFELATERVIGGVEKKSHLITPETKKIVAYHECGHGVAAWFLQAANPLLKLTIIPRAKGSIGFAQYLPHQSQISTKNQLLDQICVILSGRITQEIFFNKISTGAYDDLQKAYKLAKMIVTQYGMSQKLGWLGFQQSEYAKHYSKSTEEIIDKQVLRIIAKCTQKTRILINQKKQLIQKLATKLLEVETIDLNIINEILGPRPFKPNKQYEQYLKQHSKATEPGPTSVSFKSKFSNYIL